MKVGDIIRARLDEIGADGLLECEDGSFIHKVDLTNDVLDEFFSPSNFISMIPAFRHADGSYHVEPEEIKNPCNGCFYDSLDGDDCEQNNGFCDEYIRYKRWLAIKGALNE